MEPFAQIEELQARLEWTLDADETRIATSALEDLSDEARFYGSNSWLDATSAPRMVRTLVLKAATRFMRNPDGYEQSRAGDETLAWGKKGDTAGAASFTKAEIRQITEMMRPQGLYSANVTAWGSSTRRVTAEPIYVATEFVGGKPFPMYDSEDWAAPL